MAPTAADGPHVLVTGLTGAGTSTRVASRCRWDSDVAVARFERCRPLLESLQLPPPLIASPPVLR